MLVHCRAVANATLRRPGLSRPTLRDRIVSAFQTTSGSQAVSVTRRLAAILAPHRDPRALPTYPA
jgi:hypothetical protein